MADMKSPGSEYLKKYLIEKSMTQAQKARGETPAQKKRRQEQQAERKKNDPKRKKQVGKMTKKYDQKTNPQSRKDRDLLATAKEHPDGESAKKLEKRGLDLDNKKCSQCGSTENVHMDHVKQNTNTSYSSNGRVRWLCNKCHQPKTAQERKKLGQNENQHGRATKVSKESFEAKLHGSLQALMEAPGDEGKKRRRRGEKQHAREMQGKRETGEQSGPSFSEPDPSRVPMPRQSPSEPRQWRHTPETWRKLRGIEKQREREQEDGYIWQHGRIQRRARKPRKVGGRRIIPKQKEQSAVFVYLRPHPKYKNVLQAVDVDIDRDYTPSIRSSAREVYNALYRRINNVEYHRTYKLDPESLSKYGLTSDTISGRELGVEEDTVYLFDLKLPSKGDEGGSTTLISRSYTTDIVVYSYQDHADNKVRRGHIIRIDDDPDSPGKIITFRDLTGETTQIVTNEKLEAQAGSDKSFYRYGRPDSKPDVVNPYWWSVSTDESGKQKKEKKYVYGSGRSLGIASITDDYRITSDELFDAIDEIAPEVAAQEMRDVFLRDAYKQVADEWEKSGQTEALTPGKHNELARALYQQMITSEDGKRRISARAQEIADEPSDAVKARAKAWIKKNRGSHTIARAIPPGMEGRLREDARSTAEIFDVTREGHWNAQRDQETSHTWDGKRWKTKTSPSEIDDEFDNPADMNKMVYTLYGVEVVSPNPDHDFLRYIINGYRPEADWMSNYQAVVPQMMLAGRPREENRSIVHLQVKNADPEVDDEGNQLDPYRTIKIDWQDIEERVQNSDGASYFQEIQKIREDYRREVEAALDEENDPEKEAAMRSAMERALAETARKDVLSKKLNDETGEEEEIQDQETDESYMDRTGIRKLPLDERTFSEYNFYGEKETNGQVTWPALEVSELRYNARQGVTRGIRYAVPKSVQIYDTYDMMGNLHKGIMSQQTGEEYEWLDMLTHSDNYNSFGMMKPASQRVGRAALTSAGMKFRSTMSSAEFAVEIINPYLMKLDPNKQLAYAERTFRNAWADPERQEIMRNRAIETLATQRALDEVGGSTAWYNLSDVERYNKQLLAKKALIADLQQKDEDTNELIRLQAQDTFRLQALTSLNRSMANMQGQCPKCHGQQYLKVEVPTEMRGNVGQAYTQTALRAAFETGRATYKKATAEDYKRAKKDPKLRGSVIICNACGGTGQQLKEKATTLYAGQKKRTIDTEVFAAALDKALSFSGEDSDLIAQTVDALFPSRLTELTRTNVPAAQIKPFLQVLAKATEQYLRGESDVEGAITPEQFTTEYRGRKARFIRFQVPTGDGMRSFVAPVRSTKRHMTLQTLVDDYARQDVVDPPIYIEGKEDPEGYLLDNIASAAYGGYGELEQASMPSEFTDYRKMAAAQYQNLSPEAKKSFLQGNPTEKIKFEEMLEQLAAEEKASPDINSMQDAIRPWVTKTVLQVMSVNYQAGLTTVSDLAGELKKLDRSEDVEINRDNEFYTIAAEAYRRALQEFEVSKEAFINDFDLCTKYMSYVMVGDTAPMLEDEIEERGVVVLGCKDVSDNTDVILRYNLDRDQDVRVLRVWDEGEQLSQTYGPKQGRPKGQPKTYSPEERAEMQKHALQDDLARFGEKQRTPLVKYLTRKAGMRGRQAHKIAGQLINGKVNQAAAGMMNHLARQENAETVSQNILRKLNSIQYPTPMLRKLKTLLDRREMTESRFMPVLMIAEEIDSEAGTDGFTPEDIASLID